MARFKDPAAQLARWKTARAKVKAGDILSAVPMARLAGFSWKHLKALIDADPAFPVAKRGGEGRKFEFDAGAVLDHLIAGAAQGAEEKSSETERIERLVGIEAQAGFDIKRTADGLTALHKLKMAQGDYLPAAETRALLTSLMQTIQTEVLAAAARVDPAGRLPTDIRQALEAELSTVLVHVQGAVEDWLTKHDAGSAQERRGH